MTPSGFDFHALAPARSPVEATSPFRACFARKGEADLC